MRAPEMSDDGIKEFLRGSWVAKIATISVKGTIRITPIWYEDHGSYILMNTTPGTELVRNLRRNKSASLLIDSEPRPPSRGIHFIGEAEVDATPTAPDTVIALWARYLASEEQAARYRQNLQNQTRVFVRFYPKQRLTFDYAKI